MKTTIRKRLRLGLAIFAFCHAAAWGQVNVNGATVNATQGFQMAGAAPTGHILCGNGLRYVDAATCGGIGTFYQFVSQNSVNLPQRGRLDFSNNFNVTDEPIVATLVELASTIHVDTSGTAANASTVGGVPVAGLCQTGGAGCPVIPVVQFVRAGGCTVAGGSFTTCTVNITMTPGFADTSYAMVCTGTGANGPQVYINTTTKITGTTSSVTVAAAGSATDGYTGIDCIFSH